MNSETPAKTVLKTLCRKRSDGEIILIFPEEPGDPEGAMAVGFAEAGKYFVCDPKAVIKSTQPATIKEARMLLHLLKNDPYNYEIELIDKATKAHADLRAENKADYFRFERIKHLY